MKEQMLDRFSFPKKLKEELVGLVLYKGMDAKVVADKYGLPNVHILSNWIKFYKKKLEAGAITLAPMEKKGKVKTAVLRQRIKQLEKSLEKANVMIYGLNAMIDYAEKELKVPVRKKRGTKQSS
jgi:transposase-like protein